MKLGISSKSEIERISLVLCLGLINAIESGTVSISEANGYWFNPFTFFSLGNLGLDKKIVGVICHCCELEDVESIIPDKLSSVINNLKAEVIKLLESMPKPSEPTEKLLKGIREDCR
ncbi:MAG: DUF3969 family protein [Chitinophagales bacterium]